VRLLYRSLALPQNLADRINVVFPALSHMQCQQWSAQLLGYRSWAELKKCLDSTAPTQKPVRFSMDDPGTFQTPEAKDFFRQQSERQAVLERLLKLPAPGMSILFFHLNPSYPDVKFKKLGKSMKGQPFFEGLAHDLYSHEGEEPGVGGGKCQDVYNRLDAYIYCGIPSDVDPTTFHNILFASMQRHKLPYPELIEESRYVLKNNEAPFGISSLTYEEMEPIEDGQPSSILAVQRRSLRFFLIENEKPKGYVVVHTDVSSTNDDDHLDVELELEHGWSGLKGGEVRDAWAISIATSLSGMLQRLLWMRTESPVREININILTESESQMTWDLANDLRDILPDVMFEEAGESVSDDVNLSVTIVP
jgi:hypothetical protein